MREPDRHPAAEDYPEGERQEHLPPLAVVSYPARETGSHREAMEEGYGLRGCRVE
jgi:hypothetical protein